MIVPHRNRTRFLGGFPIRRSRGDLVPTSYYLSGRAGRPTSCAKRAFRGAVVRRRQPQGRRHPRPYPNNSHQGGTTPSSQPIYRWEGVVGVGAGMSRRHPNARGWAIRAANVSGAPRARAAFPGEPPRWRLSQSTPPSRQCRSGSHRRKSFKKQAKTSYQGKNDAKRVVF